MNTATAWISPPERLTLEKNEVHIWRASLEMAPIFSRSAQQQLSADEQLRAARFHFEKDRQRFIAGRWYLRKILSRYLAIEPAKIRFCYTSYGKPFLNSAINPNRNLRFNLAHAGKLALFAFTQVGEIGIDLEYIHSDFWGVDIARDFFSESEIAQLNALKLPEQQRAFFHGWTRKEAFVKAKGLGLALSLDQFDVIVDPNAPAALLRTGWNEFEARLWSLQTIGAGENYSAAVAVSARTPQFKYWQAEFDNPVCN